MKPIAIPRPTDPELRRQWDEAKRAVEERGKLPLILDDETRPVWEAAQRAAAEVAAWPAWKHTEQPAGEHAMSLDLADSGTLSERSGEQRWRWRCSCGAKGTWRNSALAARIDGAQRICLLQPDPDCCVGDRSQCRCAPERGGWSDEDVDREKWAAVWRDEVEP